MCGIIGIVVTAGEDAAQEIYPGLWSEQHRGQEGAGIVVFDGRECRAVRAMGTVDAMMRTRDVHFGELKGESGIGHVRYSTAGASSPQNIQPIEGLFRGKPFWLAHNGNLVRYKERRQTLADEGYPFKSTTDTEFIAALVSFSKKEIFADALLDALANVQGTYAMTALYEGKVFGVRDPLGNRPLVIGQGRGMTVLASESAACDVLKVQVVRDVEPGEMIVIEPGMNWYPIKGKLPSAQEHFCIFELVYFLRPDSKFLGVRAQSVREEMGKILWREHPVENADIVVPVPDSGNFAASGLAEAASLPLKMALFRSHYVGRTFIEPIGPARARQLNIKLNPIPELVAGKCVVLVDDSIVRANASRKAVDSLRMTGAREVHVRVSSPPYLHPCHYGIDTYRVEGELIARHVHGDVEKIRQAIGADSLGYLSIEGLKEAVRANGQHGFCDACFSGNYPIPIK